MLIYKSWCETRLRLAIAAAAVITMCVVALGSPGGGEGPQTIFILLVITLGGGSLRQEHALGSAGFTLALPVTRTRLLAARAATGIVEVVALAVVVAVLARSPAVILRWGTSGVLIFSIALGCATLVASEYAAWLAAFLVVMGYEGAVNLTDLRRIPALDLYATMQLGGPIPWGALAGLIGASAVVLVLASLPLRRRDF
jgi:ABC-2 type transport system permease protein